MAKMSQEIRDRREKEKLAAYLGINVEELPNIDEIKHAKDEQSRQVQAVLLFLERPDTFISKKCDFCHQKFLTTYQFVSVCSEICRKRSLERIGISWDPAHNPEERWKRGRVPIEYTIPPKALAILLEIAKDQEETILCDTPEQESKTYEENGSQVIHQSPDDVQESLDALFQELDLE